MQIYKSLYFNPFAIATEYLNEKYFSPDVPVLSLIFASVL